MDELGILMTFAGGLTGALILGFFAHRLKLSPIVGYLLAGIAVGPFTPGFIANRAVAEQFAEIGVILLLFGIGLRFNLRELFTVWRVALPGALIQSTLSTTALALALRLFGWNWISGIILGMAISVASTVVMALVLTKHRDLHTPIGHIAIGWTVVEDILTVLILLLLPIIFASTGGENQSVLTALGVASLKIIGLGVVVAILGQLVIPWGLGHIAKTRSQELFTLSVLVISVGIAVSSAKLFGVSIALGAFLAGLAVGRSEFAARAAGDAVPMRDAFAVLFFVSVGMLFDPSSLIKYPLIISIVLVVVVVVKPLSALVTVRLLGKPLPIAILVGAAFSQVGEFSFILGTVARDLGLINDIGWNALVAASIISIALNPSIYSLAHKISAVTKEYVPNLPKTRPEVDPNRCILVGYGPIGKIVHQILIDRGTIVTIIDLNLDTIRELRAKGYPVIYGDVLRPGTLEEAGVLVSGSLILSANVEDAAEIIKQARLLNPDLHIFVRCNNLRETLLLRRAGANVVAAGEAEVGVALAEAVAFADKGKGISSSEERDIIRQRLYEFQ